MNDNNEDLLDAIARQARVAYATERLSECCSAMQHWQSHADQGTGTFNHEGVEHQLSYYARQVERWQNYLATLQ